MSGVIDFEAEKRKRAIAERGLFAVFPKDIDEIDDDVLCQLSDPCNEKVVAVGMFSAAHFEVDGVPADGFALTPEDARALAGRLVAWAAWCERGFEGDRPCSAGGESR